MDGEEITKLHPIVCKALRENTHEASRIKMVSDLIRDQEKSFYNKLQYALEFGGNPDAYNRSQDRISFLEGIIKDRFTMQYTLINEIYIGMVICAFIILIAIYISYQRSNYIGLSFGFIFMCIFLSWVYVSMYKSSVIWKI